MASCGHAVDRGAQGFDRHIGLAHVALHAAQIVVAERRVRAGGDIEPEHLGRAFGQLQVPGGQAQIDQQLRIVRGRAQRRVHRSPAPCADGPCAPAPCQGYGTPWRCRHRPRLPEAPIAPALTISPLRQARMPRLSAILERWRALSRATSLTRPSSLSSASSRASTPASESIVGWGRAWAMCNPAWKISLHQTALSLITRERKHSKMGYQPGPVRLRPGQGQGPNPP